MGFDFEFEATRLIEKTLLDGDSVVLPITGRDVMEKLRVNAGRHVGTLLEEARRYFEVRRCSREELLAHLCGVQQAVVKEAPKSVGSK